MNAAKFVSKSAGRCATRYEREDIDSILPRFKEFVYREQNCGLPSFLERVPQGCRVSGRFSMALGFGTYGVNEDGSCVLLASLIDSSD
jgi:hypothetical protein